MKLTTRRAAAAALITGLAVGGTGIAMAATGAPQAPAQGGDTGTQEDPSYTGSVPAPAEGRDTEDGTETKDGDAAEAQEAKALEPLAKITPDQATAAAIAAVPGTAGTVELDDENGFVVYSVPVTRGDGSTVDVKVDAGNAKVLAQDTDDDTEASD